MNNIAFLNSKKLIVIWLLSLFLTDSIYAQNSGFGEPVYLGANEISNVTQIKIINMNRDMNDNEDIVIFRKHHVGWFENYGDEQFGEYQQIISTLGEINAVDVGDLNNDGDPDIAWLVQGNPETLFVGYNNGNGSFNEFSEYELKNGVTNPSQLTIGSALQGDSAGNRIFIKSQYHPSNTLWELWINQEGELITNNLLENYLDGYTFKISEFNSDEKDDFVFKNTLGTVVLSVYMSDTDSTYTHFNLSEDETKLYQNPADFVITDADNDGDLDLIYSSKSSQPNNDEYGNGYLYWFENLDNASFAEIQVIDSIKYGFDSMYEIDVNMDGYKDLVTLYENIDIVQPYGENPSRIYWYRKQETGMYEKRRILAESHFPYMFIDFIDVDKNGSKDIVGYSGNEISWLRHSDMTEFEEAGNISEATTGHITSLVSADLDNDGLLDLVGGSVIKGKGISWMKNGGNLQFGDPIVIDEEIANVQAVKVMDMDDNGFKDILALSSHWYLEEVALDRNYWGKFKLVLFKNQGGTFDEGEILVSSPYVEDVSAAVNSFSLGDFDGDGDTDITIRLTRQVLWFENEGGLKFSSGNKVADLDIKSAAIDGNMTLDSTNDGKDEIISSYITELKTQNNPFPSTYDAPVLAFHRFSADSGFYKFHEYELGITGDPYYYISGDLDSDGIFDIVFASTDFALPSQQGPYPRQITWLSQTASDTTWNERIVDSGPFDFTGIAAADIDADGDLDFVSSKIRREIITNNIFNGYAKGTLKWHENIGDSLFVKHDYVDTLRSELHNILLADLNNSGNPEIVAGIGGEKIIAIYPNQLAVSKETDADFPGNFLLHQNYPNPFNPSTIISFHLPVNNMTKLEVFDLLGRKVATLVHEHMSAGNHQVQFDASSLASGMYIYRLQAGQTSINKKMLLLK